MRANAGEGFAMSTPDENFFIGWAETPARDRRFLLRAAAGLVLGAGALGAGLGAAQNQPGPGRWDQTDVRTWPGMLVREPYPALRTRAIDGAPRTAFLMGQGKDGVAHRLKLPDGPVMVRGSIILRGANAVIAVVDGEKWIEPTQIDSVARTALSDWNEEDLGQALLVGEILDAKCWFGAMRPGEGKTHKACASLCIRGGAPAAFCASGPACGEAMSAPLIVNEFGQAFGAEILPLVADPARATGRLVRVGDVTQLRAHLVDIARL